MSIDDATPDEWNRATRSQWDQTVGEKADLAWKAARNTPLGTLSDRNVDPSEYERGSIGDVIAAALKDGTGNPKARVGSLKAPLHLVPPALSIGVSYALKDGASKYGAYNWREEPINVSTYIGAIQRHLMAYQDGEDEAEDSQVCHLAHVAACCALLMDSKAHGSLVDDRSTGPAPVVLKEFL